ncbi:hypothetical protein [Bifidobacterium apri]|uniref:Uncharacterized protein n=1 Tax=Bifidobacterium apri TaxID=1769423 RepID=A0A6A2W2V4_9BIFI|nr:hypothetical protein [Bifidobacterium apri]KAB8300789.1 hypothetical protein DSM100238_0516 [Bifidobacterium apri]
MVVIMLFCLGKTTRSAERPITLGKTTRSAERPITLDGTAHARMLQDNGDAGPMREILCEPAD